MCDVIAKTREYLESNLDDSVKTWDDIPHWSEIPNMEQGIDRFRKAINSNEVIYYVHDSDADGVGSAAVAKTFMDAIKYKNNIHRITRRDDGYGFLKLHVDEAVQQGATLIITTDNGITSKEATDYAYTKGIDVIITDHHQVNKLTYPDKAIVIDPQIIESDHTLKDVSGTVVMWYFVKAFVDITGFHINTAEYLEELALTTISDVMPLKHVNRFFVKEGMKLFNEPHKPFAVVVKSMEKFSDVLTAESLAFGVIPLINAANRFQIADKALNFISADNVQHAQQWYDYLVTLNDQRKHLTNTYTDMLDKTQVKYGNIVYANLVNVETGILGILAG